TASEGGYVALLSKQVINEGVIGTTLGTVALAAGERVTLNFAGDSLLNVTVNRGTLDALVANKQAIIADGSRVILTASAADALLPGAVTSPGPVEARTVGDRGGGFRTGKTGLTAHGGTASASGTLDASAPGGGDGGYVRTSGNVVKITDSADITTK